MILKCSQNPVGTLFVHKVNYIVYQGESPLTIFFEMCNKCTTSYVTISYSLAVIGHDQLCSLTSTHTNYTPSTFLWKVHRTTQTNVLKWLCRLLYRVYYACPWNQFGKCTWYWILLPVYGWVRGYKHALPLFWSTSYVLSAVGLKYLGRAGGRAASVN